MQFYTKKGCFFSKKIIFFRKIIASVVILQNENVQTHEIGGLALQKKKIRKK